MTSIPGPVPESARHAGRVVGVLLLSGLAATAAAGDDGTVPAPPAPVHGEAECEVWARELGFAASVARHDAEAFADHVDPQAAFNTSQARPLRGRQAVLDAWAGIIAGNGLRLVWYPTRVTIAAVPDIAWSSGPALYESTDPDADPRFRLGGFHSVWHRGADGTWRAMFDDGIPTRPASDADVAAFHAGRREACPRS